MTNHITLTSEQAQQIEEALLHSTMLIDGKPACNHNIDVCYCKESEALATIRAARAQDPLTIEAAEKMGATGADPTETERQLFEAWMKGHCWAVCGKWDGKQYVGTDEYDDIHPYVMHTRGLWAAWRDRAALAAPQPVQQVDLTGFSCVSHSNGAIDQNGELLSALEVLLEDYISRVQDAWIEAGGGDISREEVLTNCEPARNAAAAIANMTGATDELP